MRTLINIKTEPKKYRQALIALRRAQRNYEESFDTVRADVREALRSLARQADLVKIRTLNVAENEFWLDAAKAQYDRGMITNQDVVDADNDLLESRNRGAAAVASYRDAVLQFRRDTGTLRITDDGWWAPAGEFGPIAPETGDQPRRP